jgi:type 1 glutamine amidotransferase
VTLGPPRPDAPRALLLMGQQTGNDRQFHNQPEHWAHLAEILRGADLSARVITDDLADLTPANLARFDVVLNFSTDLVGSDEQIGALLDAVSAGAGFVGLHAANATFRASDAYAAMVGSRFARHPPIKRFTVEIVDRDHPVTAGLDSFEVEDERYELKDEAPDLGVLARAEGHPSVYVREHGRGRVCYIAPGHDRRTLELPQYAQLVRQAIAWAARRPTRTH